MTRRTWLAVILALAPELVAAQSARPAAPVLTQDAAIAAALTANRQLRVTALEVSKSSQAAAAVRSSRFPKLDMNLLAGSTLTPISFTIPRGTLGDYPGLGPLPSTDSPITTPRQFVGLFQASVTQPLSQLFKIDLAANEAETGRQVAQASLREAQQDVVLQVKRAYAQLAQLQSQIESAEAAVASLSELAALTDRRLAEQTVLKADDLSVKAKLSQQQYQALTLRDTFDSDRESFNQLLGRDLGEAFSVERLPPPSHDELDVDAAERQALERRPELEKARAEISRADFEARRTKAEYVPDVSLQLSYLSFANVNFLPSSGIAHLGVALQWEPFDWGNRKHRVAELQLAREQAQETAKQTEDGIRADVRAAYRRLLEARALIDAQGLSQEADRERLRVTMTRYETNAVLLADVLQAQATVADSGAQYQQALAGFWQAKAAFARALGEDK